MPAVSINWFAWSGQGMAADKFDQAEESGIDASSIWAKNGVDLIEGQEGLDSLHDLLAGSPPQIMVMPINWKIFFEQNPYANKAVWLSEMREHQVAEAEISDDFLAQLETTPTGNQSAFVYERVEKYALDILGLKSSTRIDPRQPFQDLGLDSLMAVELRNALSNSVQQELPTTLLFEYGTLQDLTDYLCETLELGEPSLSVESTETLEENVVSEDELSGVSDSDLEQTLLDELKDAGY